MRAASVSCRRQLPLLLIGAIFTALTLVYPSVGLLEWLAMIPLLIGAYRLCEERECTLRRAYGYGFLTVYVFYFVIYHWFVNLYPLDFVGMDNASSAVVIAAGWFGLPLLQAIPGGLVFLLFRLMHKSKIFERAPLLRPFAFAALWVVFEWSSTLSWAGVPWGRLALGQIKLLPMLQSASLFGSYFVSFLIVAVNGLLAYALLYSLRSTLCVSLASVLFFSNLLFGVTVRLLPEATEGETVTVAVIQGNINSHDKWDEHSGTSIREIYADLTHQAAERGAELVVWPESAMPYTLNQSTSLRAFVSALAKECRVTLIVGAFYYENEPVLRNENALFMVTPNGEISETVYAKRHLVPFGEYVPMREIIMTLIPPLANLSALDEDVTPGVGTALFETPWGSLGSLICFDSIYEELTLDSVRDGAGLMMISSNDSWFYDSAAVYQHQAQAQLRAIESGRYFARAANTGISTIISNEGELLAWQDPLTTGYGIAEVHVRSQRTLYTVVGNLFVYLCIAFSVILPVLGKLLGRPRTKSAVLRTHYGK